MALTDSLAAYWKLEESSGTRADSHGSNNLTDNNTVASAAGKIGNAAHFELLNSEWLSVADNASLAFTAAFSASLWINQTDLGTNRVFIAKWTYATDGEWCIQSGVATSADIAIYLATSATDDGSACRMDFNDADMSAGSWCHVVVVFDGSLSGDANRLKVWVNGSQKTLTAGSGSVPATLLDGGAVLNLSKFGGGLTRHNNSDMDEVGLWTRALTSDEVASLYNSGNGLAYPLSSQSQAPRSMQQFRTRRVA